MCSWRRIDLWTFVMPGRQHYHMTIWYDTVSVFMDSEIWVTYINNVLSNKTILFDILDFWCQCVVNRFVKTLSKRRMFVSSMKISACWLLHRSIKFNKIRWEKRPVKPRPNLRTSFCTRDLKNTQPHLNKHSWIKKIIVQGEESLWEDTTALGVSLQQADTTYPDKISCGWFIARLWVELLSFTALI